MGAGFDFGGRSIIALGRLGLSPRGGVFPGGGGYCMCFDRKHEVSQIPCGWCLPSLKSRKSTYTSIFVCPSSKLTWIKSLCRQTCVGAEFAVVQECSRPILCEFGEDKVTSTKRNGFEDP